MSADMGQFDARKTTPSSKEAQDQVFAKFKQRRVGEMKVKTNELTGAALDWAVAEANGTPIYRSGKTLTRMDMDGQHYWQPTFDWSQGGPIIEREGINIERGNSSGRWEAWTPAPERRSGEAVAQGLTPLIAAMRCYVASKLGDEVEIPEELK